MAFSENLQFLRTQHTLTQEQLAEQLGVSRQSVSKWESGVSFPEMDTILRICDLYNVNLDALLRGDLASAMVKDAAGYDTFMNRHALRIALAVGGILIAVSLLISFSALGVHEMIAGALFMLMLTVCVVVLVVSALEEDHFRKKHPVIQNFYTEEEKDAFHRRFVWYIAGGVGAILFGIVLMMLSFFFFPEEEPYESIVTAVFMLMVAGAVMSFIYGCMQEEKYKVWKYNRDNNPTPEAKKRLNAIGTGCVCIMLAATALYVGLGLYGGEWGRNVWLFAVGGIACAILATVLDPYKGED